MGFSEDMERARRRQDALSFHGSRKVVPPVNADANSLHEVAAHVYSNGDEAWCFHLEAILGVRAGIWTSEVGIEAIRDACNAALTRRRIAEDRLAAAEARALALVA